MSTTGIFNPASNRMRSLRVIAKGHPTYAAQRRELIDACDGKDPATEARNGLLKSGLVCRSRLELTDAGRAVLASLGDA